MQDTERRQKEIAPGIHQLKVPIPDNPLGHLNCYLVEGKDGWLMVDTGWHTTEAFNFLDAGLKELGLALTDIATIIVTHVHPDHFGLAGKIKQASPATLLLIHQLESDLIESRYIKVSELRNRISTMLEHHGVPPLDLSSLGSASMPTLQFVTVTLPDRKLHGGEIIATGVYDLEIIWTPGHSPGHICLYEPENHLLFSGDHILPSTSPNISYHVQSGDNPLGDYISALRKVQNLPVAKVLPAHQDIFPDIRGRIKQIIRHHTRRKSEIKRIIMKEPHNAFEISGRITWDIPGRNWEQLPALHKRLAVTETIAHLECMRWEGQVRRIIKDNLVLYQTMEGS
jgi:glyoxylase-like metal-dependent hydrolase (beta-lactamase superfamily II)